MSEALIGTLITAILGLAGAWITVEVQRRKVPIDAATAAAANARTLSEASRGFVDDVRSDMKALRDDMERLRERAERAEKRAEAAEASAVQAINELAAERAERAQILDHVRELHDWIDRGAPPPPPQCPTAPWARTQSN